MGKVDADGSTGGDEETEAEVAIDGGNETMGGAAEDGVLDARQTGDTAYLEQLGYRQELNRLLGFFSSFGIQFTMIAVTGGVFLTFGYGLTTVGPAMILAWVIAGGFQMVVAISVAELVSAYPLAGGAYQIINRLSDRRIGWQVGWWLVMAHIAALAAESVGLAPFVAGWFGVDSLSHNGTLAWAFALLILVTIINIIGVRIASIVNNIGVVCELVAFTAVIVGLLIYSHHFRPLSWLTETGGAIPQGHSVLWPFLFAMLVPAFVISAFDASGTAGEETKDAASNVPKGMVTANFAAYAYGGVGIALVLLSIRDMPSTLANSSPMIYVLETNLGHFMAKSFEVLAVIALFVNMEILQLTAARVLWSQSRDGQMPAAGQMRRLNAARIPIVATIVTLALAIAFTLWSSLLTVLIAMTAVVWAAGYAVLIAVGIRAKAQGRLPARPWNNGRWWPIIDGISLIWSVALCFILIKQDPRHVGIGCLGVLVAGLVIYFVLIPSSRRGVLPAPVQRDA